MMNPLHQQNGIPMYSKGRNIHRQPVCCAVIPSKFGVPLVLTTWIGLSLYFSSLAFSGRSPFYSYFNHTANIVFGVLNIIFVAVCLFGYSLHLIRRTLERYRQYAKFLACCVAAIITDMFINFIVFCVKKNEFQSRCEDSAKNNLIQHFQDQSSFEQSISNSTIAFNCSRLYLVEAEFSFACLVLMAMVYAYWVSFIITLSMNFVLMRPVIQTHHDIRQHPGALAPGFQQPIPPAAEMPLPVLQESPKGIVLQ